MTTIVRDGWQGHTGMGLSLREVEFTLGVALGKTDKQIARETGIAPDSVRKRIYGAMFKLGASRRAQLIAEAMRKAIISPLVFMLAVACISASVTDATQDTERAHRTARVMRIKSGRRTDHLNNLFHV